MNQSKEAGKEHDEMVERTFSFGLMINDLEGSPSVVIETSIESHRGYPSYEWAIGVSSIRKDENGILYIGVMGTANPKDFIPLEEVLTVEQILEGFERCGFKGPNFVAEIQRLSQLPPKTLIYSKKELDEWVKYRKENFIYIGKKGN